MLDSREPSSIANVVMMLSSQHDGSSLLVEGSSDAKLYERFVACDQCRIIISWNRQVLEKALEILEKRGFKNALGVADADFDNLMPPPGRNKNLFLTDTHDLETMILSSPALEKILKEFGSKKKLVCCDARDDLLRCGIEIGALRWISVKDKLSLKFEGLNLTKFIDRTTLALNFKVLIKTIKNNSSKHGLSEATVAKKRGELDLTKCSPWDICCGHDLVEILAFGFRRKFGTRNISCDYLEATLRVGYELAYFKTSLLYKSIKTWEKTNSLVVLAS